MEKRGVPVADSTKGQLCQAAHELGHLWRLSSNSQLVLRRALIMPTVLTRTITGARPESDWLDLHNHLPQLECQKLVANGPICAVT